jgi:hypothetical protein
MSDSKTKSTASRQHQQSDPLESARLELARLKDADDWDEPTGRTEVHIHQHPQPSQPEIQLPPEPPEKRIVGVLSVALGFRQWPQVIALALLIAGALAAYWIKTH